MTSAKTCSNCGETKAIEEFGWRSKRLGKRWGRCKPCFNASQRRYRGSSDGYTPASPPDAAHLAKELEQSWNVLKAYRVMTQRRMGVPNENGQRQRAT